MTIKKKIILGLAVVLIAIQFFQPLRNQAVEVPATHIERVYTVPQNVKAILVQSCYDCHSNNTHYPWYSRIQPGAWYMAEHIKRGKRNSTLANLATILSAGSETSSGLWPGRLRTGKCRCHHTH